MDWAHIFTLLITGGVGTWVIQQVVQALEQVLRSRGRIRSEKDALLIARSQQIESASELRNAAVRGNPLPPPRTTDAYDEWLSEHRKS